MQGHEDASRNPLRAAVLAAALALLASAIVWTALHRGAWYDEFYTQYVTRPELGWRQALLTSWLPDNHPPFFYMLMRATAWLGGIEAHRLVNLAVAALALAGGWIAARGQPLLRAAAVVLVVLLAANPWTALSATELRSYFVSLCAGALLSLALASLWISPSRGPRGPRGRQTVYALTVLVSFNTHVVTSVISGALILPFLAAALLLRDRDRLRALLPAPVAAAILFALVTAFQLPHWSRNTQVFWIPSGFGQARWSMEYAVLRTLEANPAILAGSAAGALLLLRDYLRTRKVPDLLAICFLAGVGIGIAFALLTGLQLMRPSVIEKYLVAAVGGLAFVMAASCARLLTAVPRRVEALLLLVALAISGLALIGNARDVAAGASWMGTGRFIARTVAACPDTTVHTDDFWNADVMAMSPADNRRVAPWAYRSVAKQLGFAIEPASSRSLSRTCPNLFWAEHVHRNGFNEASVLKHVRESGFAVTSIRLYRAGNGWVASDRPLPAND